MIAIRARNFGAPSILLLAAFLLQSLFVQAHVHAAPATAPVSVLALQETASPAGEAPKHEPAGTSPYCFLCWEAALAGQFIQPTAEFLPPVAQPEKWETRQAATEFTLGKSSHGWLSRAPPQ